MIQTKIRKNFDMLLPFLFLFAILLIFGITTGGSIFAGTNILTIVRQTLNVIIAALGAIFVAALGGTDITQGAVVVFAGACSTRAALNHGMAAAVVTALVVGALCGLFLGTVNARFKVPSFMCSLAMLIALRALGTIVMGGSTSGLVIPDFILLFDNLAFKIPVVVLLVFIVTYVFHFTPFGAYCRAIGENENAVKFTGINVTMVKILAFGLSGLFTGIASVFILARVGGCSTTLGLGFEMQVMMAMFIGGIPVSGGSGTKLYKIIVGAFTINVLENGLVLTGSSGAMTQLIRGAALLLVVFLTDFAKRELMKKRIKRAETE